MTQIPIFIRRNTEVVTPIYQFRFPTKKYASEVVAHGQGIRESRGRWQEEKRSVGGMFVPITNPRGHSSSTRMSSDPANAPASSTRTSVQGDVVRWHGMLHLLRESLNDIIPLIINHPSPDYYAECNWSGASGR